MKFKEFVAGKEEPQKPVVKEMAEQKPVDGAAPVAKPKRNKMQILTDKALKAVGGDKTKAASLAYQILEDANYHGINRKLVPLVDKELGLPVTPEKETQSWYRAYDGDKATDYSVSLEWDGRVVELAQRILDGVGFKIKLDIKNNTAQTIV
jgi:hypothetical protein